MHHGIREGSEAAALIEDETRSNEDLEMLNKFWPQIVAKAIFRFYSFSMNSNAL